MDWSEASSLDFGDLLETVLEEDVREKSVSSNINRSKSIAISEYSQALGGEMLTGSQQEFAEAIVSHRQRRGRRGPGFFSIPYSHRIPTRG